MNAPRPLTLTLTLTLTVSILLTIVCAFSTYAQDEKTIVSRFKTALGRWKAAIPDPPIIFKGTFQWNDTRFAGTFYYSEPHGRMELTADGGPEVVMYYNDTLTWSWYPAVNEHSITYRPPGEYETLRAQDERFDFSSKDLVYYKERGHTLRYNGKEKLDSVEVYSLTLTLTDGTIFNYFLNTRTYLLYKVANEDHFRVYGNYTRLGSDIFPMHSVDNLNSERTEYSLREVILDATIPDSLFVVPQVAFDAEKERRNHIDRMFAAGDSLRNAGEHRAAIKAYTRLLDFIGPDYKAYLFRGTSKMDLEQYYEAIADFNLAVEAGAEDSRAYNNRGLSKYYLGDYRNALQDYNAALELDPSFVTTYRNRGFLHFRSREYTKAAEDFQKAISLDEENGDSHFRYGMSLAQLQRYDDALNAYAKALSLDYQTGDVYNYRGVSLYQLGRFDSAAVSFEKALSFDQDNLQFLSNRGYALYRLHHYTDALAQFERYIAIKNDNADVYNMAGLCKYQEEDYRGAISEFTKCIELNPKNAQYFKNRGDAKFEMQDYQGAVKDYTEAITLNPRDAEVFYKRGLVKIYTSQKIEGCMDLGTANEMEYEDAKEAILKNCH